MNKLFVILLFASSLIAQPDNIFYSLRGLEDTSGVTHLFYDTGNIYHYNTANSIDTIFFNRQYYVSNYDFWNDDPSFFITCGNAGLEITGNFIWRFNDELPNYLELSSPLFFIQISRQNDSLIYCGGWELLKSTDGGKYWIIVDNRIDFLALSPVDDKTLFVTKLGELNKSTDGGTSFLGTGLNEFIYSLIYDSDSIHIYSCSDSKLYISDSEGNRGSWRLAFTSSTRIFVTADTGAPGMIFVSDGKKIYLSNDFGKTFSIYNELDRNISGLYKKPNSPILYAMTKYGLYKIEGDEIITLKLAQFIPYKINHYPLEIGNKWIYQKTEQNEFSINFKYYLKEVIGDTVTENGKRYFIVKDNEQSNPVYFYERIDSVTGFIYRYSIHDKLENMMEDLKADAGDTLYSIRYHDSKITCTGDNFFTRWENHSAIAYREIGISAAREYQMVYGLGIDKVSYSQDGSNFNINLIGAVINGVVYGDTFLADIKDDNPKLPEYSLSQNYPNPFNPVTNISYSIKSRGNVTLKVYDILGKEVATLVNEEKPAGNYEVTFNGSELASGVYIYRLTTGTFSQSKKLLLMK